MCKYCIKHSIRNCQCKYMKPYNNIYKYRGSKFEVNVAEIMAIKATNEYNKPGMTAENKEKTLVAMNAAIVKVVESRENAMFVKQALHEEYSDELQQSIETLAMMMRA